MFASFPKLIAGYYVLHRLLTPRHPPYALLYLNTIIRRLICSYSARSAGFHQTHLVNTASTTIHMQNVKDHSEAPEGVSLSSPPCHSRERTQTRPVFEKQAAVLDITCRGPITEVMSLGSLKEVIQPQVPLRLPCYDFTPIIDQTVGTSLPLGLGQ